MSLLAISQSNNLVIAKSKSSDKTSSQAYEGAGGGQAHKETPLVTPDIVEFNSKQRTLTAFWLSEQKKIGKLSKCRINRKNGIIKKQSPKNIDFKYSSCRVKLSKSESKRLAKKVASKKPVFALAEALYRKNGEKFSLIAHPRVRNHSLFK